MPRVWIGWDPREIQACAVAEASLRKHSPIVKIHRLALSYLTHRALYTRETVERDGQLWDVISNAPMSTEHAISRFFVPYLQDFQGWALFVDGDVLFRIDVAALFALRDERYAVQVVHHPPLLKEGTKKDGSIQQAYARKNWSSVMLFNCAHQAHRGLTLEILNSWPGRDLHAFKWLRGYELGSIPAGWNHLVNLSAPDPDPALVHFTEGCPNIAGHELDPFAEEWRAMARWAGYQIAEPEAVRVQV